MTTIPPSCATPLHVCDALENACDASDPINNPEGRVAVPISQLVLLIEDARTLQRLINEAHYA